MFIVLSDESGDLGPTYNNGSNSMVIAMGIFKTKNRVIKDFNDIARELSKKYLGSQIRKWSELKGYVKNDPTLLISFFKNLFSYVNNLNTIFILSFFILNKKELETGFEKFDKEILNNTIAKGYVRCFKRIIPFVKRYGYHINQTGSSELTRINWIVDCNTGKEASIKESIYSLLSNENIDFFGPLFIKKTNKKQNPIDHELATTIKVMDLFAGVFRKCFEYYLQDRTKCENPCCLDLPIGCKNKFINLWKLIFDESSKFSISVDNKKIWTWQGIIYDPINKREHHECILGKDPFLS